MRWGEKDSWPVGDWYAWRPVQTKTGAWAWLERVYREPYHGKNGRTIWSYSLKD